MARLTCFIRASIRSEATLAVAILPDVIHIVNAGGFVSAVWNAGYIDRTGMATMSPISIASFTTNGSP